MQITAAHVTNSARLTIVGDDQGHIYFMTPDGVLAAEYSTGGTCALF